MVTEKGVKHGQPKGQSHKICLSQEKREGGCGQLTGWSCIVCLSQKERVRQADRTSHNVCFSQEKSERAQPVDRMVTISAFRRKKRERVGESLPWFFLPPSNRAQPTRSPRTLESSSLQLFHAKMARKIITT